MNRLASLALAPVLALLALPAIGQEMSLEDYVASFLDAPGFERQDVDLLNQRLDANWLDTNGISPGGEVGPIEKAVLLAETAIGSIRTRTAVAYAQLVTEQEGPVSFIEVEHYNLGPTIHAQTVAEYGEDDVADAVEFGEGEHMAWRFVFQPLMGNTAILMGASAHVISDKAAAKAYCTSRPCLDLAFGLDDFAPWEEIEGTLPSWPSAYPPRFRDIAIPAQAIAELAVLGYWANAENGTYQWTGGEHPEGIYGIQPWRYIGIDRNLGQDDGIDVVWQESLVNDDEIADVTFRRVEVPGAVTFMRYQTLR